MTRQQDQQLPPEVVAKFWSLVDRTPGHGPDGSCWLWTGSFTGGYPRFRLDGKLVPAGRVALWIVQNRKPRGLIGHQCQNPGCVNPAHLVAGRTGLYATTSPPNRPPPPLNLPAILQPADVATYAQRHSDALNGVANTVLLSELSRRIAGAGAEPGLAEDLRALLGAQMNDHDPEDRLDFSAEDAQNPNYLYLRLQCLPLISPFYDRDLAVTYVGAVIMNWNREGVDADPCQLELATIRYAVVNDVSTLNDRADELRGLLLAANDDFIFPRSIRQDESKDPEDRRELSFRMVVIEELVLADPVKNLPLHGWIVDAIRDLVGDPDAWILAYAGPPESESPDPQDAEATYLKRASMWVVAGLRPIRNSYFMCRDLDDGFYELPDLPDLAETLSQAQLESMMCGGVSPRIPGTAPRPADETQGESTDCPCGEGDEIDGV